MTEPRRIAVATFGRSDFSILRPLCEQLDQDPDFTMGLLVGGAHFEDVSGRTIEDVEASGLPIWTRVDCGESDRTPVGTVQVMAAQMTGFADAVAAEPPDLVLILGDRYEAVSAGLAMVPLGVPVGHISGGSITEGAIDDVFRHCLTKIAAVHFCDLPAFARRIHRMGEAPERIFTTGALGLDAAVGAKFEPFDAFVRQFGFDGLEPGFILAALHPETGRPEVTESMASAFVAALDRSDAQVVYTYPNADPGSDGIVSIIETAATADGAYIVRNFGADWFPTALEHAGMIVGNSSSGIIEAASFELPVVNIGDRQLGREHGPNVIHCERDETSILAAIDRGRSGSFDAERHAPNIYGDGRGADRVIAALKALDWDEISGPKPFVDPDAEFVGEIEVLV